MEARTKDYGTKLMDQFYADKILTALVGLIEFPPSNGRRADLMESVAASDPIVELKELGCRF